MCVEQDAVNMFDLVLRPIKDRILTPAAVRMTVAPAGAVTALALVACVGAGASAALRHPRLGVVLWLCGRALDGLDGAIARARGTASDLGGYLDQLADTVGYAVVPLGLAAASSDRHAWPMAAVLVATFYVNTVSWTYLSALAEKRAAGAAARGEVTSIHMPVGLVEGAETIVAYTVMLAFSSHVVVVFTVMAVAVAATVVQRLVVAQRLLR